LPLTFTAAPSKAPARLPSLILRILELIRGDSSMSRCSIQRQHPAFSSGGRIWNAMGGSLGAIWSFDASVDRNNLWHHFARFAEAVKDLDPPVEGFQPAELKHPRLRAYALRGERTILLWCRDASNTWQTELEQGWSPEPMTGETIEVQCFLGAILPASARAYDPWANRWTDLKSGVRKLVLPEFTRSLIVRLELPR
jgi:hypothetical protein